jgi:hypothetical protein
MEKKLIALIFLLLALSAATPVLANNIIIDGLNEEQSAQVQLWVAQIKKQNESVAALSRDNKWTDFGKNLSQALAASAKELGIPAETLIQTDFGQTAKNILIWKMLAKEIAGLTIGLLIMIIGLPIWVYFFRRICVIKSTSVEYPNNEKNKKVIRHEYFKSGEVTEARLLMTVMLILTIGCSVLIIFLSLESL